MHYPNNKYNDYTRHNRFIDTEDTYTANKELHKNLPLELK